MVFLRHLIPAAALFGFPARKHTKTTIVLNLVNVHVHLIADFNTRDIGKFIQCNGAFGLKSYVDNHGIFGHPQDISFDNLAFLKVVKSLFVINLKQGRLIIGYLYPLYGFFGDHFFSRFIVLGDHFFTRFIVHGYMPFLIFIRVAAPGRTGSRD